MAAVALFKKGCFRKMGDGPKKKNRKHLIKIGVSVLLIGYLLYQVDIRLIWEKVGNYPFSLLVGAFFMIIGSSAIGAASLHALYPGERVLRIFLVTLKSCFYSMVLPGQLLGESAKILLLSPETGSFAQRTSAVIVDKALNSIVLLWLGMFGVLNSSVFGNSRIRGFFVAGSFGTVAFLLVGVSSFFCRWFQRRLENMHPGRVKGMMQQYFEIWEGYAKDKRALFCSVVYGVIYHLIINFTYCTLAAGLSMQVCFWDFCWINALLTFILLLPVSVGGLGVREVSLAGMLGMLGIGRETAFSFSVLLLFLQVLRALAGGILILAGKGRWL